MSSGISVFKGTILLDKRPYDGGTGWTEGIFGAHYFQAKISKNPHPQGIKQGRVVAVNIYKGREIFPKVSWKAQIWQQLRQEHDVDHFDRFRTYWAGDLGHSTYAFRDDEQGQRITLEDEDIAYFRALMDFLEKLPAGGRNLRGHTAEGRYLDPKTQQSLLQRGLDRSRAKTMVKRL